MRKVVLAAILAGSAFSLPALAAPGDLTETGTTDKRLEASALTSGQYAKAVRRLSTARFGTASDPARLINLGNAYAGMGRKAEARTFYLSALRQPDSTVMLADGTDESSQVVARRALDRLQPGYAMR